MTNKDITHLENLKKFKNDLLYLSLRSRITFSYLCGDFSTRLGQMEMSLKYLDSLYSKENFKDLGPDDLKLAVENLLHEVQEKVDAEISAVSYGFLNGLEEGDKGDKGDN